MADAEDMDFVADNFVTDDIGVDERPLAKIVADRTTFVGKLCEATAGVEETCSDVTCRPGIELTDIAAKALQIPNR